MKVLEKWIFMVREEEKVKHKKRRSTDDRNSSYKNLEIRDCILTKWKFNGFVKRYLKWSFAISIKWLRRLSNKRKYLQKTLFTCRITRSQKQVGGDKMGQAGNEGLKWKEETVDSFLTFVILIPFPHIFPLDLCECFCLLPFSLLFFFTRVYSYLSYEFTFVLSLLHFQSFRSFDSVAHLLVWVHWLLN